MIHVQLLQVLMHKTQFILCFHQDRHSFTLVHLENLLQGPQLT